MPTSPQPSQDRPARTEVLVIGGGLLGCAISYRLASQGVQVVLAEKDQLNGQASGQNAGSLHFQLEFRMIENGEHATRVAALALPLHVHAQQTWASLAQELGDDLGVVQQGGFMLAETSEQVDVLNRKMVLERAAGLEVELLDRTALLSLAPYFGPSIVAAAFCPDEGKADPRRCSLAFARAATRLGAQVFARSRVTSLRREGGFWHVGFSDGSRCQAENVVIAAGAWSGRLARMAGIALPISPIGLTMAATARTRPFIKHLVQHAGRRLSMKQTAEGNVLIGGGWPAALRHVDGVLDLDRKAELLLPSLAGNMRTAATVVPEVAGLPVLRVWTGVTAFVADQLPLIGAVPRTRGLFIVTGSSAFTLGPTFASIVSDQILGRTPAFDVSLYDPQRFGSLTLV